MYLTAISSLCLFFGLLTGNKAVACDDCSSTTTPQQLVCNYPVVPRLPPQFGGAVNPYFIETPPGYFAGLWYQTYTSVNDSVLAIHDVQLLSLYNATSGVTMDLTSYLVGTDPHVYTTYATDQASPSQDENYPLYLPGTNNTIVTQDIVAYGVDTDCHRYFVVYGPAPTPGLVLTSQIQTGPSNATVQQIKCAFQSLGNDNITAMAAAIKPIPGNNDGQRNGLQGVQCDQACLTNQNSPKSECNGTDGVCY